MSRLFAELAIPGTDLLLRTYGLRAYALLEVELRTVPLGRALVLDFAGVSLMDTSFADESVLELALGLVEGRYSDRFLILERPSPATVYNLEGAIARRRVIAKHRAKIALLVREQERMRVIGRPEPNLSETWDRVVKGGTLTARVLADELGLEISAASMRLHKLYNARLLARREEITAVGREHIYEVPT